MHGLYEVLQRRVVKYLVLKDHLASLIKAVWRNMASPHAALEHASCSLNLYMTLKYILCWCSLQVFLS